MPKSHKTLAPKPSKEQLFIKKETKSVNEVLAGMKGGESRSGFLGENLLRKPDYVPAPENLDTDGVARKKAIQSLLMNVIEPAQLSSKSTIEMDRRSLFNKLKKSSLDELNRMIPGKLRDMSTAEIQNIVGGTTELTDGDKADIQDLYKEVSP